VLAASINRSQRLQVVNRHSTVRKRHDVQHQGCFGEFVQCRIIGHRRAKNSEFGTHPIEMVINLLFCERLQADRALKIKAVGQGFIFLAAATDPEWCPSGIATTKVVDRTGTCLAALRQYLVQSIKQEKQIVVFDPITGNVPPDVVLGTLTPNE